MAQGKAGSRTGNVENWAGFVEKVVATGTSRNFGGTFSLCLLYCFSSGTVCFGWYRPIQYGIYNYELYINETSKNFE